MIWHNLGGLWFTARMSVYKRYSLQKYDGKHHVKSKAELANSTHIPSPIRIQ